MESTAQDGRSEVAAKIAEQESGAAGVYDIGSRVDAFPEPWKPEPGDKFVGTIQSIEEFDDSKNEYPAYPLLIVLTDDGREIAFHAFHTVAKRELARQRASVGDRIAVKYFGRTENDRGYERYRLLIDKPQKGPDWERIEQEATAELEEGAGDLPLPTDV